MDTISRFFECLVPISKCNLKCSYCYVMQEGRRNTEAVKFVATPEEIGRAFSQARVGGLALINLCGFGETLIPKEMPQIIYEILKQGQYVNVTNNGTMSRRFQEIMNLCPVEYRNRLSFAFSFHYVELKNRNLLDVFINNVKYVRDNGCSFVVQLNLADEYIPLCDEIKDICLKEFGALPQIALTRRELNDGSYEIMTSYPENEYISVARSFNSPLFEFTLKNFNQKRTEFCYAGVWSYKVDLGSGMLRSCNCTEAHQNIYHDLNEPIKCRAVGNCCTSGYCVNSSHYMSLGVIPSIDTPSYVEVRNRPEASWYQPEMQEFLSHQFTENHKEYSKMQKLIANISQESRNVMASLKKIAKKILK